MIIQTDRPTDNHTNRHKILTNRQTEREKTLRQADTERQAIRDRQTDRQTLAQAGRRKHTNTHKHGPKQAVGGARRQVGRQKQLLEHSIIV